ncbi:diaminopimelate epimerase [Streptomyces sp. NPDC005955]|uniref:diaminopimelate epimerase n=1 Tax=Streptomyces sp. NPDC005955 TaxID=3364738 RepID=UPI0036CA085D
MALSITKTHGSLNDILVIDGAPTDHFAPADVERAVRLLCDRDRGLGADGVYFIADDGDGTARAYFYNPDGSASLLCGNGMRGAGRLLLDRHQAESVVLHTGPYAFTVRAAGTTGHGVRRVSVELPPVDFAPAQPIVAGADGPFVDGALPAYHPARRVSAVAVPNSHLITVLGGQDAPDARDAGDGRDAYDAYDEAELIATGTRVAEAADAFPIGANVSFVRPLTATEVFVRTFERGAGLTPSCGSGVAASRAVLSRLGLVDPEQPVVVRNPGGVARSWMQVHGDRWQPVLEGNATNVYAAELDPAVLLGEGPVRVEGEPFAEELHAFAAFNAENLAELKEAGVETTLHAPSPAGR